MEKKENINNLTQREEAQYIHTPAKGKERINIVISRCRIPIICWYIVLVAHNSIDVQCARETLKNYWVLFDLRRATYHFTPFRKTINENTVDKLWGRGDRGCPVKSFKMNVRPMVNISPSHQDNALMNERSLFAGRDQLKNAPSVVLFCGTKQPFCHYLVILGCRLQYERFFFLSHKKIAAPVL